MKKIIKIVFFLFGLCTISGLILSFVWDNSRDQIIENEKKAKLDAVKEIFPGAEITEKMLGEEKYWKAEGQGFAFESGIMGFQDEITAVIGVDAKLEKVKGIIVIRCLETPGLGDDVKNNKFLKQFRGGKPPFKVVKTSVEEESDIQAVTGATISSRAVVKMINDKIIKIHKDLQR